MEQEQAIENARELISKTPLFCLSTVSPSGQPEARAMVLAKSDNFQIWMTTAASSRKIKHIKNEPRVCAYFFEAAAEPRSLHIFGTAEVIDDEETKKKLWQEDWKQYYPGGVNDPEYTLIKITPRACRYSHNMEMMEFVPEN